MNEVSTTVLEPKNYILVFTDNSTKEITASERDRIFKYLNNDYVMIENSLIKTYRLGEILPKEEYYQRHPHKREHSIRYDYPDIVSFQSKDIKSEKILSGLIQGFNSYINGGKYQGTQKPIQLRDKYQKRLEEIVNYPQLID